MTAKVLVCLFFLVPLVFSIGDGCVCNDLEIAGKSVTCSASKCVKDTNGNCIHYPNCTEIDCGSGVAVCTTVGGDGLISTLLGSNNETCQAQCICTDDQCTNSAVRPCETAKCVFSTSDRSCNWIPPPAGCPVNLKCDDNSCGDKIECAGTLSCELTGNTCAWNCKTDSNVTIIDCTGRCDNSAVELKCATSGVKPTCSLSSVLNLGSMNSSSDIVNVCKWVCPDVTNCDNWCKNYVCDKDSDLVSCGPNPSDSTSCSATCSVSKDCSNIDDCLNAACPAGSNVKCVKGNNNTCVSRCEPITCNDPCAPNCVPICGPVTKCGYRCAIPLEAVIPDDPIKTAKLCVWVKDNICVEPPVYKCPGTPLCTLSKCLNTGEWDDTPCTRDCGSLGDACPLASSIPPCVSGRGSCNKDTNGNCYWSCPLDPCRNSDGTYRCVGDSTNIRRPDVDCASWSTLCLLNNTDPYTCAWTSRCDKFNPPPAAGCTKDDCANQAIPEFIINPCPGGSPDWKCGLSNNNDGTNVGSCRWIYSCPSAPLNTTKCVCPDNSAVLYSAPSNNFCGVNPTVTKCTVNADGRCQWFSYCPRAVDVPDCRVGLCQDVCYDPRWLLTSSDGVVPPPSFNVTRVKDAIIASCATRTCLEYCRSLLLCGRQKDSSVCEFMNTDAYDICVKKCKGDTPPPPNNTCRSDRGVCGCDYKRCTYIMADYGNGKIAEVCALNSIAASVSTSFVGKPAVYTSNALPDYCVALANLSSNVDSIVNKIRQKTADDIRSAVVDILKSAGNSSNIRSFISRLIAVLTPTSSGNSISIGLVITLSGDKTPSSDEQTAWCNIYIKAVATATSLDEKKFVSCRLSALADDDGISGSVNGKRSILSQIGSYVLSGEYEDTSSPTSPTDTPTTPGMNPPTFTPPIGGSPSGGAVIFCSMFVSLAMMLFFFVF